MVSCLTHPALHQAPSIIQQRHLVGSFQRPFDPFAARAAPSQLSQLGPAVPALVPDNDAAAALCTCKNPSPVEGQLAHSMGRERVGGWLTGRG